VPRNEPEAGGAQKTKQTALFVEATKRKGVRGAITGRTTARTTGLGFERRLPLAQTFPLGAQSTGHGSQKTNATAADARARQMVLYTKGGKRIL